MTTSELLLLALCLDAMFGEPRMLWSRLPHPAVIMGRAVAWLDRRLNTAPRRDARVRGVLALVTLVIGAAALGVVLAHLPLGPLWTVLLAAILLAQRSLTDHVAAVADALRLSLGDGRLMVARIVGRDTAEMDEAAVARAAIESAAENLSDGVVAPAFWFLIAGLPGLLVYKVVNTADSMIGYRTDRYEAFGWAAARFDDLLNWVPARLTALAIAGVSGGLSSWGSIVQEARRHRSPNAGWPEAAAARALGVALSGPRSYHGTMKEFPYVFPEGRKGAQASDIDASVALLWRVWWVLVVTAGILAWGL